MFSHPSMIFLMLCMLVNFGQFYLLNPCVLMQEGLVGQVDILGRG